jgi:hypothetical protein
MNFENKVVYNKFFKLLHKLVIENQIINLCIEDKSLQYNEEWLLIKQPLGDEGSAPSINKACGAISVS